MRRIPFFTYLIVFCFCFLSGYSGYHFIHQKLKMQKACLYIWDTDQNNRIFSHSYFFKRLKEEFAKWGYDLATQDIHPISESALIFSASNYPPIPPVEKQDKMYIFLPETPFMTDFLYDKKRHKYYNKIFTYDKELVDHKKILYLQTAYYDFDKWEDVEIADKNILAVQVASNLDYSPKRSLYYERRNLVKWFVENYPEDFKFYGKDWKHMKGMIRPENKEKFDESYKGYVKNKKEVVRVAKFAFAYENSLSKNYVSEKIYDVMNAGTVPIYIGAEWITDYVPSDCFIDKREFENYEDLYLYLKNMPDTEYQKYMNCIKTFVMWPRGKSPATDVETGIRNVTSAIFENQPFHKRLIYDIKNYISEAI